MKQKYYSLLKFLVSFDNDPSRSVGTGLLATHGKQFQENFGNNSVSGVLGSEFEVKFKQVVTVKADHLFMLFKLTEDVKG